MSQPYVGEVRLVGFTFAPEGWLFCNGQLVSIAEYETLFTLIGTTYGGDGQITFGLPDLRGCVPIHQGTGPDRTYVIGQKGGTEMVTLTLNNYPAHNHQISESTGDANAVANPANSTVAGNLGIYTNLAPSTPMQAGMIGTATGGSQPHDNLQPYLALNWIISLYGIYPTQN
jgi:microcystin-dependent protein